MLKWVAIIVVVLVIGAGGAFYSVQHRPPTLAAPGVGWGVHVCAVDHYIPSDVACKVADVTVSLDNGYLSFTGHNGANFPATGLLFVLSNENADGTSQTIGQFRGTASLATNILAYDLKSFFADLNVTPEQGTSYQLEVDTDSGAVQTLLGTVAFTVGPQKPIACAPGRYQISIPYGWVLKRPCTDKNGLLIETPDQGAFIIVGYAPGSYLDRTSFLSSVDTYLAGLGTIQGHRTMRAHALWHPDFMEADATVSEKGFGSVALLLEEGIRGQEFYAMTGGVLQTNNHKESEDTRVMHLAIESMKTY